MSRQASSRLASQRPSDATSRIVIPPALGYGATGSPPAVAPNETLVFVVDLVGVQ